MARYTDPANGRTYDKGPDDFLSDTNTTTNSDGTDNLSFDEDQWNREWAEWEAYKKNIDDTVYGDASDNDGGSENVATYPGVNGNPPDSDEDHDFSQDPDLQEGISDPPPVPPGGKVPPNGTIVVSTEAMKTFVNNIGMLYKPMENSFNNLKNIQIEPGGFAEAWNLEDKIEGKEGLVPATSVFISKVRNNLVRLTDACEALSNEYTNAEEFNKLKGDKLNDYVGELRIGLTGMGGQETAPPA